MADRFAVGRAELPSMRRHVRKAALPAPTHEWVTDRAQRASEVSFGKIASSSCKL
eukprot:m.5485 g.5485  ORF g.5485 m.5485 type:complete len:55 (-) comp2008_c0_seq2:1309-1473(-)